MCKLATLLVCLLFLTASSFAQSQSIDQLVEKGNELFDKGQYDAAIALYHQALAIDSNAPRANYEMANTCINTGKYEDAIRYTDKVINFSDKFADQAYTLKGTAFDMLEKYDEALQTYLEGIKKYPDDFMLRYNISLTYYNRKQYPEAEFQVMKAIELHPSHASSHLLLAQCMQHDHKRVQSLMCLYYFLMLENDSKRSPGALAQLQKEEASGVTKEGKNQINISVLKDDDFSAADLALSMSQALKFDSANASKTPQQLFYDQTKVLFSVLAKNNDKSIWSKVYVPFYEDLAASGHLETFCYYISATDKDGVAARWLKDNDAKVQQFGKWYNEYYK